MHAEKHPTATTLSLVRPNYAEVFENTLSYDDLAPEAEKPAQMSAYQVIFDIMYQDTIEEIRRLAKSREKFKMNDKQTKADRLLTTIRQKLKQIQLLDALPIKLSSKLEEAGIKPLTMEQLLDRYHVQRPPNPLSPPTRTSEMKINNAPLAYTLTDIQWTVGRAVLAKAGDRYIYDHNLVNTGLVLWPDVYQMVNGKSMVINRIKSGQKAIGSKLDLAISRNGHIPVNSDLDLFVQEAQRESLAELAMEVRRPIGSNWLAFCLDKK